MIGTSISDRGSYDVTNMYTAGSNNTSTRLVHYSRIWNSACANTTTTDGRVCGDRSALILVATGASRTTRPSKYACPIPPLAMLHNRRRRLWYITLRVTMVSKLVHRCFNLNPRCLSISLSLSMGCSMGIHNRPSHLNHNSRSRSTSLSTVTRTSVLHQTSNSRTGEDMEGRQCQILWMRRMLYRPNPTLGN
jgi:hypothetical protein